MKVFLKWKVHNLIVFSLIILLICPVIYAVNNVMASSTVETINFYVATTGDDTNIGSEAKPFKTLEAVKEAIRTTTQYGTIVKNITVFIRGGNYPINKTFVLEKIDSGSEQFPVTYRSYGKEEVMFNGGYNLTSADFKPLQDKAVLDRFVNKETSKNILVADLSKYPLDFNASTGDLRNVPELFYNNNPMTLARYTNDGFLLTGQVISDTNNPAYSFKYSGTEPSLWSKNQSIRMSGYWYHNWSDSTVRVSSIDTTNNLINFTDALPYGIRENQRFYFSNVLEELDREGEYYIDYDKKLLYFLPNADMQNSKIQLSRLIDPIVILNEASNITFQGITFENGRGTGIVIYDGNNNKTKNCVIRNISENAFYITGGFNNGVEDCKIYNTGTGGVIIIGGDRNTLTPSNSYIKNNEIYNYSRIKKTYSAAINISGVGITASNNSIHDAEHTAIMFNGNDHLLQYNEIYNVAMETDDVGAIYIGRDWTYRGNIIRYNYLHNIDNNVGNFNTSGVYLDDCMSSAEVYGNVFYKVKNPIFIGGGRDHIIKNNVIVDCKNSINIDARGLTVNLSDLYTNLNKVPYDSKLWTDKYPLLKDLLKDGTPGVPNNNIVQNNLLYLSGLPSIDSSVIKYGTITNNISYTVDPGFVNLAKMDFRLSNYSNVFKEIKHFKNIPFKNIGLKPYTP